MSPQEVRSDALRLAIQYQSVGRPGGSLAPIFHIAEEFERFINSGELPLWAQHREVSPAATEDGS